MSRRKHLASALLVSAATIGLCIGWIRAEGEKKLIPKTPEVIGSWTGDWGPFDPATEKEFAGFYTSSHHVGVFRLARPK